MASLILFRQHFWTWEGTCVIHVRQWRLVVQECPRMKVPQDSTCKGNPMVKFPKQLFSHQPGTGWEHPLFSSEVVTQGTLETRSSTWSPDGVVLLS